MSATFLFPDKSDFSPDMKETARYLGYSRFVSPDQDVSELLEKAASEMAEVMKVQAVFEVFDLSVVECRDSGVSKPSYEPTDQVVSIRPSDYSTTLSFADVTLHSRDLGRNLSGCSQVALLAATIGPQVDTLIRRYSSLDPVYASILQATGAMFIEELVDLVNAEIKKIAAAQGLKTKPRYSPGYGDVPLQVQKDFFRLLPCTRIGLTLMDTLIMAPEKSVTAFVGIGG
ncbi:vitamin B12 dependent-methionine synthase activation domain-containing protein [Treponema bryantii]|uniref:vitamin B12 dependent-methionine synthase activation domain-containing protein n=1 Tax=Treponema bryantii TaxID=163 RepID=UPI0003B55811|nr:vitamin B12 dependent-methionine synthase activation domain-containing protein [Treponema bryantii]